MTSRRAAAAALAACLLSLACPSSGVAADETSLSGRWTLNRAESRIPAEVGFGMDLLGTPGANETAGGDSASPAGAAAMMAKFRESADEASRKAFLVNEVQHPPAHLAITQNGTDVYIVPDGRKPRTFRSDGREAVQPIEGVPIVSIARWVGPRLEIRFPVGVNREVRYEMMRAASPDRLLVDIRLVERNGKDSVSLVYQPTRDDEPASLYEEPAPPPKPAATGAGRPLLGALPTLAAPPPDEPQERAPQIGAPVATGPDAVLVGLRTLGVVVEELRPQAAGCGVTQAAIESLVTKPFADAGFKLLKDSDEDTYLYVDIGTSVMSQGVCISRYDVFLYTNAAARLSYQKTSALAQVQLLHRGGLVGGAAAVHAEALKKNLKQSVDEFVDRIKAVNK